MRLTIHRGAHQIGGTCIELEAQGHRLVLDIGVPLDADSAEAADMPTVAGFDKPDASLLGVVLSHPHLDHYGLSFRLPPSTAFLMGEATERILAAATVFTPSGGTFENVIHLADRKPISLGQFTITPFLMDHSAYDSYALLIEADGRKVFYTGDLRAHGRKGKLFECLVAHPPVNVDVLLMEGTTIGRQDARERYQTEEELVPELTHLFRATKGLSLVWCSGQNIDRLVTIYKAARKAGRQLILDMYTAHILKATGNPRLPQADWDGVRVFLPKFQKNRIKRQHDFALAKAYRPFRIFPEHLAEAASRSVMLFRPSMRVDVEEAGCLDGAELVYSLWDGYLKDKKQREFLAWLKKSNIPLHKCHTSGHAPLRDLQRLRTAFQGAVVVPIHTEQPGRYREVFGNVQVHTDGEWWEIEQQTNQKPEAEMSTKTDNTELAKCLRAACAAGSRNIRLPQSIEFTRADKTVRMYLSSKCVKANMQDDASSFEGWALALKYWLDLESIVLKWEPEDTGASLHYQRFLYRAQKFQSLFGAWFSISPESEAELGTLKTSKPEDKYWLNVESAERRTTKRYVCDSLSNALLLTEHGLECYIADHPEQLKALLNMDTLHRQCPVGVFRGKVTSAPKNEIFPRHHSAIDLWGVNRAAKKLFLFELKKTGNIPIGILSEMLFYTFVMEDIQLKRFGFKKNNEEISITDSVSMFILAPDWHPLINEKMLQFVNKSFQKNNRRIRFGAVRIESNEEGYKLEIPACD